MLVRKFDGWKSRPREKKQRNNRKMIGQGPFERSKLIFTMTKYLNNLERKNGQRIGRIKV